MSFSIESRPKNASDMSVDENTSTSRMIANAFMNLGIKIAKTGRVLSTLQRI